MSEDVVPDWVEGFSPEKQVEWFSDHWDLRLSNETWNRFYCSSVLHKGPHCSSCMSEEDAGYADFDDDYCCCLANRVPA